MPTAFVTGATGFVGLNLIDCLGQAGWDVVAMHRPSSDLSALTSRGVDCVVGDVVSAPDTLAAVPHGCDCVFHVAGDTSLWRRSAQAQTLVNVAGTRNVVQAALANGAKRMVYTSSAVAFGLHSGRINESTPVSAARSPINYVRSKAMAEREVQRGVKLGLSAVIVNPSNMLGPFDQRNWSRLFVLIQQRRLPGVPSGGGSFCDVGEVAGAHLAAAEQGMPGNNYLLGGVDLPYVSLVGEAARRLNRRVSSRPMPAGLLKQYARLEESMAHVFRRPPDLTRDTIELLAANLYCDPSRACRELGFKAVPLSDMLDGTLAWMQQCGMLRAAAGVAPGSS